MKVAFDYSIFMMQKYGGVSRYFLELYKFPTQISIQPKDYNPATSEQSSIYKHVTETYLPIAAQDFSQMKLTKPVPKIFFEV